VLAARRDQLLDDLAEECRALGVRAIAAPTDVSEAADVRDLYQRTIQELGYLDVWINNAGIGAIGRFEDIPLADHEQVIRTNLLGVLYGSLFAYRHFRSMGTGTLINIASELGKTSVPYFSSYIAAKHGVVGLSASLRQELNQEKVEGIHVCCIMPTAHDTPFFDHAANYSGHETNPPRPLHDAEDVVETIVALARNPRDEKIVGSDGYMKFALAHLAQGLSEAMGGRFMRKFVLEEPPPAPSTSGSVHEPVAAGTGVSGGRRERESRAVRRSRTSLRSSPSRPGRGRE
jgi:short-subunit dehydrogenase